MTTSALSLELTRAVLDYLDVQAAPPSLSLLDALVAAYIRTVPWESAFRIARRARIADTMQCPRWPDIFWADAIERGGGGTCFESNFAFFSLLRALGFDGALAINDMHKMLSCHTAILVNLDGERWLTDVGLPLHVPLPVSSGIVEQRTGPFHTYTVRPEGDGRYAVERTRHLNPYCFTLIDQPVSEADYRAATAADYGPNGLFLDRVIVTKVIGGAIWRFNSGDDTLHLERFREGSRTDVAIEGDVAETIADRFAIDEATVRLALERING